MFIIVYVLVVWMACALATLTLWNVAKYLVRKADQS